MIGAVVLAGGASSRMGSPKSLLKIGEKSFVQHIVDELRSADVCEIVVVLGSDAEKVRASIPRSSTRVVVNEAWSSGQLTSLIAGLNALESADLEGIIVWPVDRPLIGEDVVRTLLDAFRTSTSGIVVPVFKGRRGHPVIFPTRLFDELRSADPAIGARQVVHRHADDIVEVPTSQEGVVLNIDTPEDYRTTVVMRTGTPMSKVPPSLTSETKRFDYPFKLT